MTNVEQGGTHDVTMTTGYGNQYVRIWIDFNDDYAYTIDELVLDNYIIAQVLGQEHILKQRRLLYQQMLHLVNIQCELRQTGMRCT